MVKGVNDNFDNIINVEELPVVVNMTLLMFKDNIIFSSIFSSYSIDLGNHFRKMVVDESSKAMKYYHL